MHCFIDTSRVQRRKRAQIRPWSQMLMLRHPILPGIVDDTSSLLDCFASSMPARKKKLYKSHTGSQLSLQRKNRENLELRTKRLHYNFFPTQSK